MNFLRRSSSSSANATAARPLGRPRLSDPLPSMASRDLKHYLEESAAAAVEEQQHQRQSHPRREAAAATTATAPNSHPRPPLNFKRQRLSLSMTSSPASSSSPPGATAGAAEKESTEHLLLQRIQGSLESFVKDKMSKSVDVIDSCLDASFKSMEKHLTQVADDSETCFTKYAEGVREMEQQEQQHVQKMRALFNSHVTRLEELLQQYHDVQMEIKASHKQFGVKSDALLAEFEDRIIAADDACTLIINDFVSGVSNMKVETEATMLKKTFEAFI